MNNLNILITGSAKRLGKEMALYCAQQGAGICIHYNTTQKDHVKELVEELKEHTSRVHTIQADLSDLRSVNKIIPTLYKDGVPINTLINNASIFPESNIRDIPIDALKMTLEINSFAPLLLAQSLSQYASHGLIVNMLDTRIRTYDTKHAGYYLSKVFLEHITKLLALELSPAFRVNAIAPGMILPPKDKDTSYFENLSSRTTLNTHGEPEHIFKALSYIVENDFVNAEILFVDGGQHLKENIYGGSSTEREK